MSKVTRIDRRKNNVGKYLLIVVFILAITLVIITRMMRIDTVEISGNQHYSDAEICDILNIEDKSNVLSIYFNTYVDLETYPYIENIDIKYQGFNKIKVKVIEKNIIGYIPILEKYLSIDKDGYVVDYTEVVDPNIPIIQGIEVLEFIIGEKINVSEDIINAFLMFYQSQEKYNLKIKHLLFVDNNLDDIRLNIDDVEVLFGNMENFNYKMQHLKDTLPMIQKETNRTYDLENQTLR